MNILKIKNIAIGKGIPKICVSLMGKNKEDIEMQCIQMKDAGFDILEWRIDYLDTLEDCIEIAKSIQSLINDKVLLYTFRTIQEGGKKAISKEEYINLYKKLISHKVCDMIDVEMFMDKEASRTLCAYAHQSNMHVIGSYHDFHQTPNKEELIKRFIYMQERNADICKIACMPNCEKDVEVMMSATKEVSDQITTPLIAISMGELGKITRIKGQTFKSAVTFGCINKASAPGQIEVEQLKELLKKEAEVLY